jgi:hypothetical protein
MPKQLSISPYLCTGLIVVAVSALSCALVFCGILFLMLLR